MEAFKDSALCLSRYKKPSCICIIVSGSWAAAHDLKIQDEVVPKL